MPWRIELTPHAARDMGRLEAAAARRVATRLEHALKDPMRSFRRLSGSDLYKLRVGDHRVLAHIARGAQVIIVQRIDHRSRIYKR